MPSVGVATGVGVGVGVGVGGGGMVAVAVAVGVEVGVAVGVGVNVAVTVAVAVGVGVGVGSITAVPPFATTALELEFGTPLFQFLETNQLLVPGFLQLVVGPGITAESKDFA